MKTQVKKQKRKIAKVKASQQTVKNTTLNNMILVNFTLSESDFREVKIMTLDLRLGYRDIMLAGLNHLKSLKGK